MISKIRTNLVGLLRESPFARTIWAVRDISEGIVSRVTVPFHQRRRCGAAIVNYHGVTPRVLDPAAEVSHIPAGLFRKQIRHLKKYYQVVSLIELVDRLDSGHSIPNDWVALTFDDGFRNNLTCAWQILQEEGGIPMSVFIVTELVGTNNIFWADLVPIVIMYCRNQTLRVPCDESLWEVRPIHSRRLRANLRFEIISLIMSFPENLRHIVLEEFWSQFGNGEIEEIRSHFSSFDMLNWDEVRFLHGNGVDIGSHTRTHAYLRPELGLERMREEIFGSRDQIQQELGKAPDHFCTPNGGPGDFSEMSMNLLREAGYRCGLTTVRGMVKTGDDQFELKRQIQVGTIARFRAAVAGSN